MPTLDPRIDAYIANSAEFAQPILTHLRQVVHEACPEVEETIKWSMPFFLYQGMLCNMASFKAHCAFGFWKGELLGPRLVGPPIHVTTDLRDGDGAVWLEMEHDGWNELFGLNHQRREAAQKRPRLIGADETPEGVTLPDQHEALLHREVVEKLPRNLRDVYVLSRFGGLTYAEIATHLGISVKAVEKRMTQALRLCVARYRS